MIDHVRVPVAAFLSVVAMVGLAPSDSSPQSSPNSLTILPGEDVQARVNVAPPGSTFILKSGVHRLQSIVPRSGDRFVGEAGTVLSGARLLRAARSGSYWV